MHQHLRPARPHDALAVARVHVRSWQAGCRGLMPDEILDALRPEDRADRYDFGSTDPAVPRTLVAEDEAGIGGFVSVAPAPDAGVGKPGSEVCALYVDPDRWGTGVGRALMAAGRAALIDQGFATAGLWLLAGNRRAQRFYAMDAWQADGTERDVVVWGVEVHEVRLRTRLA